MKRRTWATVGGLALASAVYATLLADTTAPPVTQPTTQPAAVQPASQPADNLHAVKKGTIDLDITADGVFQAVDPVEVRLKLKAYNGPLIINSIAAPGQLVKKGDLLLEIETIHLKWALTAAENELTTARAALAKAEADQQLAEKTEAMAMRQTEQALSNAEAGLKWWEQMDSPQMLKSAEMQLKQYRDMLTDQQDELDQLKKMYKSEELTNATADIVLKRALRRLDLVKIVLGFQEQAYSKFNAYLYPMHKQRVLDTVDVANHQLVGLRNIQAHQTVVRGTSLANARISVEQAEKKLRELREDEALFRIVSPTSGLVQYGDVRDGAWQGGDARNMRPGERLSASSVVMRVINPGKLCVELSIPDNRAFLLTPGLPARISPSVFPGVAYTGVCGPVVAVPRGTPATVGFNTTIAVNEADPRVLPGMRCSVRIEVGKAEEVVVIPLNLLSHGQVNVRTADGKTEKRTVKVGRSDGRQVEVLDGLSEGDQIVLEKK